MAPGKTRTFSFVAPAGVYMYHCGTAPLLQHIGMGMYGMIIVDPLAARPPAKEITLVQSEFYGRVRGGFLHPSLKAMRTQSPRYVAFNGRAQRYFRHPIAVPVGEPVRIYLVDAGRPWTATSTWSARSSTASSTTATLPMLLHGVSTQLSRPGAAGCSS